MPDCFFTRVVLRPHLAIDEPLGLYIPPEGPVVDLDRLAAKNRAEYGPPPATPGPLEQRVMQMEDDANA